LSLFKTLRNYYVEKTIEKSKFNYDLIKSKSDSINQKLRSAEYSLAKILDTQKALFQSRDKLPAERLKIEIRKLLEMQPEIIKQLELADLQLKSETPFIQVLDRPRLPLKSSRKNLRSAIISAVLLSFLLGIGFLVGRKFLKEILA